MLVYNFLDWLCWSLFSRLKHFWGGKDCNDIHLLMGELHPKPKVSMFGVFYFKFINSFDNLYIRISPILFHLPYFSLLEILDAFLTICATCEVFFLVLFCVVFWGWYDSFHPRPMLLGALDRHRWWCFTLPRI